MTEKNILNQAHALATKLKPFGYDHINVDAGWGSLAVTNTPARSRAARFFRGMKAVATTSTQVGLKSGIYTAVGLGIEVYRDGNMPI